MQKSLHSERNQLFLAMLRKRRLEASITQFALAAALQMRQSDVSKVELGARRLDVLELHGWLQALGASFVDFAQELDATLEAHSVRRQVGRRGQGNAGRK